MSTRKWDERITTRYTEPERNIYEQVMALVKENNIPKSKAQLLLVERGLQHTQNPEPIIKTVVKEVPVEKIVKQIVYRDPPKVDKSIPQEHIGVDDHITEQPASKGQAQDSGQGKSTPNTALGVKKSLAKKDGISGWSIAGGLGIVGLLIYILVR